MNSPNLGGFTVNLSRLTILASACFAFVATVASAQSAPPVADTYSFNAEPAQNFGAQPILVVQPGANSYIRFNLSSVPAGVTVNKATLRLYLDAITGNGSFEVYQLGNSWGESTLSYSNAPSMGASATGGHPIALTTSADNQFVLIDITSLVQGWIEGSIANNGLALSTSSGDAGFSFDSKESVYTSHQPELEIVLNGPAGAKRRNWLNRPQVLLDQHWPAGPWQQRAQPARLDRRDPLDRQGRQVQRAQPAQPDRRDPLDQRDRRAQRARQGQTEPLAQLDRSARQVQQVQPVRKALQDRPVQRVRRGRPDNPARQDHRDLQGLQDPQGQQQAQSDRDSTLTGLFSTATAYSPYDVVTYNGSTYEAPTVIAPSPTTPNLNPAWVLMAQAGAPGRDWLSRHARLACKDLRGSPAHQVRKALPGPWAQRVQLDRPDRQAPTQPPTPE